MKELIEHELGITPEREKVLNDRGKLLIQTQPTFAKVLQELDKQDDISSIEKLTLAATISLWIYRRTTKQRQDGKQFLPVTSMS